MMYWGHGFGWAGMIFGGLLMLLFWAGVIALAVFAIRAFTRSAPGQSGADTLRSDRREDNALAILRERYARGEIDKEQYERMRSDLLG